MNVRAMVSRRVLVGAAGVTMLLIGIAGGTGTALAQDSDGPQSTLTSSVSTAVRVTKYLPDATLPVSDPAKGDAAAIPQVTGTENLAVPVTKYLPDATLPVSDPAKGDAAAIPQVTGTENLAVPVTKYLPDATLPVSDPAKGDAAALPRP